MDMHMNILAKLNKNIKKIRNNKGVKYFKMSTLESISYFYNIKNINIKLMNGDLFSIQINDFDDEYNLIEKICDSGYNYRLRKHRIKIFKDCNDENDENDIKKIFYNLKDNDVLNVFSESPVNIIKYDTKYFFNPTHTYNYFIIKDEEDYLNTIDIIYFEIYNKELPLFFHIKNDFLRSHKEYIENILKIIFDKEDIKQVFFKCNNDGFLKYLKKYYKDLDTIRFDFYININESNDMSKLIDKLINSENLYINSFISFEY